MKLLCVAVTELDASPNQHTATATGYKGSICLNKVIAKVQRNLQSTATRSPADSQLASDTPLAHLQLNEPSSCDMPCSEVVL